MRHEVRAVRIRRAVRHSHTQIGLVQQRRRAEDELPMVVRHLTFRQTMEICVHGRKQLVSGSPAARIRVTHEFSDTVVHALVL